MKILVVAIALTAVASSEDYDPCKNYQDGQKRYKEDPKDCSKFYECQFAVPPIAHRRDCPAGTSFKATNVGEGGRICNGPKPSLVIDCYKGDESSTYTTPQSTIGGSS